MTDIYDVATYEPGHMVCDNCGAVFEDYLAMGKEWVWDGEECPSCHQPIRINVQEKDDE